MFEVCREQDESIMRQRGIRERRAYNSYVKECIIKEIEKDIEIFIRTSLMHTHRFIRHVSQDIAKEIFYSALMEDMNKGSMKDIPSNEEIRNQLNKFKKSYVYTKN